MTFITATLNAKIQKIFPLLIVLAIALGLVHDFPPAHLQPLNLFCISLLLFFPTLKIDPQQYLTHLRSDGRLVALSLPVLFILLPLLSYSLGKLSGLELPILVGLVLTSAAPTMLSAPYLTGLIEGDFKIAWSLTITSTFTTPLVLIAGVRLAREFIPSINLSRLLETIGIVVLLPVALAILIRLLFPRLIAKLLPFENLITLSAMVLINWMVVSFNQHIILSLSLVLLLILLLICLLETFGIFFLVRWLAGLFLDLPTSKALAISYSMRNVALIGGILVVYDVKFALASSIFSLVYAFMLIMINKWQPNS